MHPPLFCQLWRLCDRIGVKQQGAKKRPSTFLDNLVERIFLHNIKSFNETLLIIRNYYVNLHSKEEKSACSFCGSRCLTLTSRQKSIPKRSKQGRDTIVYWLASSVKGNG